MTRNTASLLIRPDSHATQRNAAQRSATQRSSDASGALQLRFPKFIPVRLERRSAKEDFPGGYNTWRTAGDGGARWETR
jgi:hypothetical protein